MIGLHPAGQQKENKNQKKWILKEYHLVVTRPKNAQQMGQPCQYLLFG